MFFDLFSPNKRQLEREREQLRKIAEGQKALVAAATSTAAAADNVAKQLRDRLEDSLQQYESTIKILADALLVANKEGEVEAYNPAAQRMFGYNPNELATLNLTDLFVHSEDLGNLNIAEFWSIIEEAQSGDEAGLSVDRPLERVRGIRKDSSAFYCDITLSKLVRRASGQSVVVVLVRDITTHLLIQEKLAGTLNRYQRLFDDAYDGLVVVQNHVIRTCNASTTRITGYSHDELVGRTVFDVLHPNEHEPYMQRWQRRVETGRPDTIERVIKIVNVRGEIVSIDMRATVTEWNGEPATLAILREHV